MYNKIKLSDVVNLSVTSALFKEKMRCPIDSPITWAFKFEHVIVSLDTTVAMQQYKGLCHIRYLGIVVEAMKRKYCVFIHTKSLY